jgi:hypothetical protein
LWKNSPTGATRIAAPLPYAVRAAGEIPGGDLAVIVAVFHRVEHGAGSTAIAPRRDIVCNKCRAKVIFNDLSVSD